MQLHVTPELEVNYVKDRVCASHLDVPNHEWPLIGSASVFNISNGQAWWRVAFSWRLPIARNNYLDVGWYKSLFSTIFSQRSALTTPLEAAIPTCTINECVGVLSDIECIRLFRMFPIAFGSVVSRVDSCLSGLRDESAVE